MLYRDGSGLSERSPTLCSYPPHTVEAMPGFEPFPRNVIPAVSSKSDAGSNRYKGLRSSREPAAESCLGGSLDLRYRASAGLCPLPIKVGPGRCFIQTALHQLNKNQSHCALKIIFNTTRRMAQVGGQAGPRLNL